MISVRNSYNVCCDCGSCGIRTWDDIVINTRRQKWDVEEFGAFRPEYDGLCNLMQSSTAFHVPEAT